jgi:hypothetical protein
MAWERRDVVHAPLHRRAGRLVCDAYRPGVLPALVVQPVQSWQAQHQERHLSVADLAAVRATSSRPHLGFMPVLRSGHPLKAL